VNGYLFDTNVLSEVLRKRPNSGVVKRLGEAPGSQQYTSCICQMEMRYGSLLRRDAEPFWQHIQKVVFQNITVLGLSPTEAIAAADILARLTKEGRRIGVEDLLIAATALERGLIVVTRNLDEFQRVPGLAVENWFN
jgi:tRNA(fMet)-specific endonuclease VapC